MDRRNPFRCFDGRYLVEAILVSAVVIGLALVGKGFARGSSARIAIAVAQGAAFAVLIARTLLALRSLDELQQRIHLIAIAISFGVAAVLATTGELVSRAGFAIAPAGLWIWGLMGVTWGIGVTVLARRYR